MLRFIKKRWKRTREPSTPAPLEDATHQITDIGAEYGEGSNGECLLGETRVDKTDGTDEAAGSDINHRVDFRIPTQDRRIGDQQLPAPNPSILTPGHESDDTSECSRLLRWGRCLSSVPIAPQGRGHTREGSALPQSELGRSDHVLRSDEKDSDIPDRGEHENQGLGVQQTSGAAAENASSGGQDDGDTHDPAKPGKSRGKSRCPGYAVVYTDPYLVKERGWIDRSLGRAMAVVELAKGPAEAFGPLKAVLQSISVFYTKYQVYLFLLCSRSSSDSRTSRAPLTLGTRSKYFAHASLR